VGWALDQSSWRLGLLPDELEEVLPEDQYPLADLMKRQPFAPEHPPCCLSYSQPPLKLRQRVQLVGPDEARLKF